MNPNLTEQDFESQAQPVEPDTTTPGKPVAPSEAVVDMRYAALYMHDYSTEPRLRDLPFRLLNIPRLVLLAMIRLYQATLSKSMPANSCRFYPSCSHYGYQAIYKHGVLKGSLMATWRVLRCNPFNPGGYDPVT